MKKAVALKFDQSKDEAPRVIAKGKGVVAEKILEIARKYGVPIKRDRALTEALIGVELNQEIPPELYKAVAEILAFIYKSSTFSKK